MSELDDQMIELTIEALTGTVYDLCVSPFETILGIKMKIQRLEGIPVYQQQLVHGNTELHDEFCLEEYSIGSGAQLKLLLAMRGGPIHAHRIQLEDPTLLEIAEVLEDQDFDHKYTVMLLRDGETLDMADLVQVVAEESPGHVSPLPQTTSSEQETTSSLALSKVTRNKMQDLMCRLRSRKQTSQAGSVSIDPSGSQLQRRGAKVLILDSRSSSRLLHSAAPSPGTPHPRATPTQNPSTVYRKLVFPAEEVGTHSSKCEGSSAEEGVHSRHHRAAKLDTEGSVDHRKQQSSRSHQSCACPQQSSELYQATLHCHPHKQSDRQQRHWRRKRRPRRPSCLQEKAVPHGHKDVSELAKELSLLGVREERHRQSDRESHKPMAHPLPHLMSSGTDRHTTHPHHTHCSGIPQLPSISVGPAPCLTGRGRGEGRPHCAHCGKKTRLTTTYACRCGGVFCSLHRYAESHDCSFDYKTQGREIIARGNPLIVAPKLPKI